MLNFDVESLSQEGQIRPESILPKIKHISAEFLESNWKVYFNDVFEKVLIDLDHGKLIDRVYKIIHQNIVMCQGQQTRKSLDLFSTPLTLVVLPEVNEVRILSVNLSDELFIVQELTKAKSPLIDSEEFLALSDHLQAAALIDVSRFPTAIEELTAKYDLPDLLGDAFEKVEHDSKKLTGELVTKINEHKPALFERVSDFALGLTAEYAS